MTVAAVAAGITAPAVTHWIIDVVPAGEQAVDGAAGEYWHCTVAPEVEMAAVVAVVG